MAITKRLRPVGMVRPSTSISPSPADADIATIHLARMPSTDDSRNVSAECAHTANVEITPLPPASSEIAKSGAFPSGATRVAEAFRAMPVPGEMAFGFQVVREIGRGAFGRVFLASQPDLAGRYVVLKVSADLAGESRVLAQLQHTNIVPVYSAHRAGPLQAVCMPYFGATTFQNLLRHFRDVKAVPATGRAFVETLRSLNAVSPVRVASPPETAAPGGTTDAVLHLLGASSYVRGVAWLVARVADGLAHAHERGLIHRDIKPANILLTDDGQPMLLDFGVAEEIALRATVPPTALGGTVAYMAPEHLNEVRTGVPGAEPRSDVYSLGIVLYELLTGRFPFRLPTGTAAEEADRVTAERRAGPLQPVRDFNSEVSPGLESIVMTCLASDPAARYPTAAALRDDLDCYLADQPLKIAPERSLREVARKWARRHPRLTSVSTLGMLAAIVLITAGAGILTTRSRLVRLEAEETYRAFRAEAGTAQQMLYAQSEDVATLAAGLDRGRAAVAKYAPDQAGWDQHSAVTALAPAQREQLRRDLVETCLMIARGEWLQTEARNDIAKLEDALQWNTLAQTLAGDEPPRMLFVQRATMLARLGRPVTVPVDEAPPRSARDFYFAATVEFDAGRPATAAMLYRKAQAVDPKAFWAHYGEGVCELALGQWASARGCFSAALAIDPEAQFARFNRAYATLHLNDPNAAETDLTTLLDAHPDYAEAYLTRAEARSAMKDYHAALEDLDTAISQGLSIQRVLPLRSKLRALTGDAAGALADQRDPESSDGWVLRGIESLTTDLPAALKAFDKAVALDPKSVTARMYQAYVYGETSREADCIKALSAVLELEPTNAPAMSGRGVMHARLGHDAEAKADAATVLTRNFTPAIVFQVAEIYALLSKREAAFRAESMTLIGIALRAGYGHDMLITETDLDALRMTPEFIALVASARRDRPTGK